MVVAVPSCRASVGVNFFDFRRFERPCKSELFEITIYLVQFTFSFSSQLATFWPLFCANFDHFLAYFWPWIGNFTIVTTYHSHEGHEDRNGFHLFPGHGRRSSSLSERHSWELLHYGQNYKISSIIYILFFEKKNLYWQRYNLNFFWLSVTKNTISKKVWVCLTRFIDGKRYKKSCWFLDQI